MIDLFAGCGGMTKGFVEAGFMPVLAVEWEHAAAATYAANFGDHVHCGDIAELRSTDVPPVDVVVGGPPCQGFSNLGSRDPGDSRNKLWREYLRVVRAASPLVFVIENVDRFARSPEFALLLEEVASGSLGDYRLEWAVLNAADYGVPQRRKRTIIIGSRAGQPAMPPPTHSKLPAAGTKPWATVRDAFDGLPYRIDTTELPDSRVCLLGREVGGIFKERDLHFTRNPRPLSLARYDHVPPGGGRFDVPVDLLPNCWRNKPTGTTDVMGRMRWDRPSLTIRTEFFKPEKGQYLHPQWDQHGERVNRVISHAEAARLQTFPRDYLWCGTKVEIARQIGNAVPVRLASVIAAHLRDAVLR